MIPQIMSRIWDGDPNEYFTASDMRRVEDNANILARYAGVPEVSFLPTTRASQFRYDEAQKVESLTKRVADHLGVPMTIEPSWNYNRTVSFVDFERWEANLWKVYKALGGVGERIPSDKFLHTVHATLFASEWRGKGPYYIDLDVPLIRSEDGDYIAYLDESCDTATQISAYNALLQVRYMGVGKVRVYAHSIRPRVNIPIKITSKVFDMHEKVTLKASAWQGSGPWTQSITLGSPIVNGLIGSDDRNDASRMTEFSEAIIGVSGVSGNKMTVRAIGSRPTLDLSATVMWSADSTEGRA